MARRKRGQPVHGWLILDKSEGMTSTEAVGIAKRLFDARKAGHAGTLDPLATGILPLAFGEATKTVPFIVDGTKSYRFRVQFGAETDTDDCEGQVVRRSGLRPARPQVEAALPRFLGEIAQVPPQYSAVKVEGARAYDLARDGETVELKPRLVRIDRLALTAFTDPGGEGPVEATFEAECGKGTYVRAIARDLGRMLGCLGHIVELRRTRVGPFGEDAAISLDKLRQLCHGPDDREGPRVALLPLEAALDDILALAMSDQDALRIKRGQPVLLRGAGAPIHTGPAFATSRGSPIALGEIRQGEFQPTRVFNFSA
ncbi:MAG: tRNA pseudouridine(55) synthase TruB [Hyphomicrobiaceae bacterium]